MNREPNWTSISERAYKLREWLIAFSRASDRNQAAEISPKLLAAKIQFFQEAYDMQMQLADCETVSGNEKEFGFHLASVFIFDAVMHTSSAEYEARVEHMLSLVKSLWQLVEACEKIIKDHISSN